MEQLDSAILSKVIQQRPTKSHKGTFGRAVLVGGNRQFGGAICASLCVWGNWFDHRDLRWRQPNRPARPLA